MHLVNDETWHIREKIKTSTTDRKHCIGRTAPDTNHDSFEPGSLYQSELARHTQGVVGRRRAGLA